MRREPLDVVIAAGSYHSKLLVCGQLRQDTKDKSQGNEMRCVVRRCVPANNVNPQPPNMDRPPDKKSSRRH